jgi:hypothetical protein
MSKEFHQDMPPVGGYRPFNWNRTYAKTLWGRTFYFHLKLQSLRNPEKL